MDENSRTYIDGNGFGGLGTGGTLGVGGLNTVRLFESFGFENAP